MYILALLPDRQGLPEGQLEREAKKMPAPFPQRSPRRIHCRRGRLAGDGGRRFRSVSLAMAPRSPEPAPPFFSRPHIFRGSPSMPAILAPAATRPIIVIRPNLVLPPNKSKVPEKETEPRLRPEARGSMQRWLDLCG